MQMGVKNNFDLIRLFAATQVAITHTAWALGVKSQFLSVLSLFPGVPIFFFISGYLIYGSYEQSTKSNKSNLNFFIKRFLRLYPALWFCFLISVISVWYSGYFENDDLTVDGFLGWAIAQISIFQFYNPEFMREYGVGVMNGSLWTVSVEIQFYLLTPFIFAFLKKSNIKLLIALLTILICLNLINTHLNHKSNLYYKLFNYSFAPWLYMFVLGSAAYKYSSVIESVKRLNFVSLLMAYLLIYFLTNGYGWGNGINPVAYLLLVILIIKSAYTLPNLSDKILNKNDVSYGVYIFHMPIVNYFLYHNITGSFGFFCVVFLTFLLAIISWFFLEKKVLSFKRYALRKN